MPPISQRDLVSALLESRGPCLPLGEWIADRREENKTWEEIAEELTEVTDGLVAVSYQTVARWANQLDEIEKAAS